MFSVVCVCLLTVRGVLWDHYRDPPPQKCSNLFNLHLTVQRPQTISNYILTIFCNKKRQNNSYRFRIYTIFLAIHHICSSRNEIQKHWAWNWTTTWSKLNPLRISHWKSSAVDRSARRLNLFVSRFCATLLLLRLNILQVIIIYQTVKSTRLSFGP